MTKNQISDYMFDYYWAREGLSDVVEIARGFLSDTEIVDIIVDLDLQYLEINLKDYLKQNYYSKLLEYYEDMED